MHLTYCPKDVCFFFYLEMLAAPKNHILQHDISARNPGTEPQSRERATEGDSLQGKGADHTLLNGEEGDYHREKFLSTSTPSARSPLSTFPKMTNLDVSMIIFSGKDEPSDLRMKTHC